MRVENIVSSRGNKIPNQFVITDGSRVIFQSYESTIATVDECKKTVLIGEDWNYSTTTGKYRNIFFGDYTDLTILSTKKELEKALKDGYAEDRFGTRYTVTME